MPGIRDQVGAIPTQLAFALVCVGIGSIVGMPFTGRLVDRYSSQTVSRLATAICLGGWAMLPAMSAPGEVPGRGSRAIAVVSTIGYGGFLFGAPLIGFLAHLMPLDRTLLAVAALVLLVAILAPVAREHGRELVKA